MSRAFNDRRSIIPDSSRRDKGPWAPAWRIGTSRNSRVMFTEGAHKRTRRNRGRSWPAPRTRISIVINTATPASSFLPGGENGLYSKVRRNRRSATSIRSRILNARFGLRDQFMTGASSRENGSDSLDLFGSSSDGKPNKTWIWEIWGWTKSKFCSLLRKPAKRGTDEPFNEQYRDGARFQFEDL